MSWHPASDPILGDKRSCDALELVIVPRARDLGGFEVRRALPHGKRQMVGPFIFFDQMGPVQFIAGQGIDVRPHPHIGLATVTYLFDGRVMHRDSEGNALEITPGAMNLMTAGRGIAHSERTPAPARARRDRRCSASRAGSRLPAGARGDRAVVPAFRRRKPAGGGGRRPVGARHRRAPPSAARRRSACCRTGSMPRWCWRPAPSAPLDPDHEERAIYVVEGEVEIAGDSFEGPRLLVFRPGDRITVKAQAPLARLMFLGGTAMEGPRYIWWNFVSSRRERIEEAKEDWKAGRFAPGPRRDRIHSAPRAVGSKSVRRPVAC